MRFIRSNNQGILGCIAGEMLNQEYGKKLFEDGKYIEAHEHQSLPELCYDGVKILIKPNFGLLYVDDRVEAIQDDYARWVKLLTSRVEALSSYIHSKYDRSKQFTTVECGEDGFTSMKVKILYSGTKYFKETAQPPKSNLDRAIYSAQNAQIINFREKIGLARFTWIVYPLSRIYHGIIASANAPDANKALYSYFTLIYDPSFVIRDHTNSTSDIILRDLTVKDIKYANEILPLYSAGELNCEEIINRLNSKKQEPTTPETPTEQTSSPTQDDSSDRAIMQVSLDNMINNAKFTINMLRYPGFIPGLDNPNTYRIMYCPKRLGAIELIKQLGRFPIHDLINSGMRVPIHPITQDVYDTQDPVIDNTPFPNDACAKCLTPLYDDIYLTYNTVNSPTAKAYCPVCMHSCYKTDGSVYLTNVFPVQIGNFSRLYDNTAVLAKTKYNRTYNHVIDMIPNETIKEILRSMYSKRNTVVTQYQDNILLFVDIQSNQDVSPKVFVGFTELGTYYDYCHHAATQVGDKYNPAKNDFMGTRDHTIFERATMFPITFVTC
jgi:hypothetical protein